MQEREGGLRISGSWAIVSGSTMASHVGGMVILPPLQEGGLPRPMVALGPVAQATIVDAWDPIGLGGSGSHDVRFDDLFVPHYRTFAWPAAAAAPDVDYPAKVFVSGIWFISNCAAATHLGLARRARMAAVHRSTEVVRMAYDCAGASAIRRDGVLERLLREATCLTHHVSANLPSYEQTGRVRSGAEALSLRV